MITGDSKPVLFLMLILIFGGFSVNQAEGGESIPQIWEIAEDISWIESILHATRFIQTCGDRDVGLNETVMKMFIVDLDGLQQRNLTGFQQDLAEITRVFDEQCPSDEGCKVGGDLENGVKLMEKLEEFSTLEQRIPNLVLMNTIYNMRHPLSYTDDRTHLYLEKINNYPQFSMEDFLYVAMMADPANNTIKMIWKWQELARLVGELNTTSAKEELDMLLRVQNETLNLATEQVLVDGFASSVETLKLRTEKLKGMEEKVEKVISQLDWLVEIEDGVKDPFNNHSIVPNVSFVDVERVPDEKAGKRVVMLTKLDEEMIENQMITLRDAKKRLEKWMSVRRALRDSGGAAVESSRIRSILGNAKSSLEQLPTVKSVRECMDKFNLTNLNVTVTTPKSMEDRRKIIVDNFIPFTQIGFNEDDMVTLKELVTNETDYVAVINRWKQISNLSALTEKIKKLYSTRYNFVVAQDEAELVARWLNNTGILNGVACLQMDRKMDSINGSTGISPLYSNNSDLTNIISMNRNLTQLETMWRDEKGEQLNASNGRRVVQDIGNLTETFSQLSSAFRASSYAIKYDADYQLVINSIEVINQTMEGLPVEVKNRALWSNQVLSCLKEVKILSDTLKTSHSKLATYQTLDDLVTILDGFQGDFRCDSSDVFRRILPYTNDSLQSAVLKLSDLSLSYAGVESVAQVILDVSTIFNDIQQQYATTTVPTKAESFKQVQDQRSMDNESEDGDDESAVSSVVWIIIVLVVLLVIAGLSVAVYFRFFHKKTKRESAEVEKKTENVDKTAGTTAGSGEKIQKDSATGNVADLP